MPKIFSDARKQSLYKIIKQNCINLIREKGFYQLLNFYTVMYAIKILYCLILGGFL